MLHRVAIVPARGGSKRIPRKNIKSFCGKPIIAYTIETLKSSKLFDKVIVSSDDTEIISISKQYGAEAPFIRPHSLSDDYSTTREVLKHAISELQILGVPVTHICCVYPTNPFLQISTLTNSFDYLVKGGHDYVFSACRYAHPVQRAFSVGGAGKIQFLFPEHRTSRTQDVDVMYHDAAQFYWGKLDHFLVDNSADFNSVSAFIVPQRSVVDIDDEDDWAKAEFLWNYLKDRDAV